MRSIPKTCDCCGSHFMAGSDLARWCSSSCSMRAYQRRRRGAPEADPGVCRAIRPQAVQPELLSDPDELPAEWAAAAAKAQGLECRSWNGTSIQRRESDGYVNATAMCKAGGRRWNHYIANDRTREYIRALAAGVEGENPCSAAVAGNPATLLVESVQGGRPDLQGTWIHPRLAVDLARWISPAFAVWMDGWFLETLALPQAAPPRPEPQLPKLPPSGPAILIRAKTEREAAQIWCDTLALAASGAIRRRYSTLHRGPDVNSLLSSGGQWQHLPG